MTAKFLTPLEVKLIDPDKEIWQLDSELVYSSDVLGRLITVPAGFKTDFASVPRLPLAYSLFGGIAQEEAVIHDYLYQTGICDRKTADRTLLEAMGARGKAAWRRYPMFWGVRAFGWMFYNDAETETTK